MRGSFYMEYEGKGFRQSCLYRRVVHHLGCLSLGQSFVSKGPLYLCFICGAAVFNANNHAVNRGSESENAV